LPQLIQWLATGRARPRDGVELCDLLHQFGMPLRKLGALPAHIERRSYLWPLVVETLVARAAKQCFSVYMSTGSRIRTGVGATQATPLPESIADFLNALLGPLADKHSSAAAAAADSNADDADSDALWTSDALWQRVRTALLTRFDFTLPSDALPNLSRSRILRLFALQTGVQLRARVYQFTAQRPFAADDVAGAEPRLRHVWPRDWLAESLLARARYQHAQRNLESALTLIETLQHHTTLVGAPLGDPTTLAAFSLYTEVLTDKMHVLNAYAQRQEELCHVTHRGGFVVVFAVSR
jgi:hypothetical protein